MGSPLGTWEFLSSRILRHPDRRTHNHVDDLESFLHVLHYILSTLPLMWPRVATSMLITPQTLLFVNTVPKDDAFRDNLDKLWVAMQTTFSRTPFADEQSGTMKKMYICERLSRALLHAFTGEAIPFGLGKA